MSLVYFVRWRCTTSCDLVRPSKIILRYPTMLGISAKFLNITNTPKTSGHDPWWLRRRATSHDYTRFTPDGPRSSKFTHRKSSYGVVKTGVTVALVKSVINLRRSHSTTPYAACDTCIFTLGYCMVNRKGKHHTAITSQQHVRKAYTETDGKNVNATC